MTCGGGGGGGGGEGGTSTDIRVKELASRISERLPGLYDIRKAHPDTFKVSTYELITEIRIIFSKKKNPNFRKSNKDKNGNQNKDKN